MGSTIRLTSTHLILMGCRLTRTCSSPKRCLPALLECCFASIVSSAWLTFLAPSWVSATPSPPQYRNTPENFRQRLARARRDLRNFMNDKCGLVNQANPCRCAKKTRGVIRAGCVDPQNLLFVRARICEVREAAPKVHEAINTLDEQCAEIFRGHPFYKAPDIGAMLRRLVARTHITA